MRSPDHLHTICRIGKGEDTCRYLVGSKDGLHCAKLVEHVAAAINHRVGTGRMKAQGNNCGGYPIEDDLGWPIEKVLEELG